MAHEYVDVRYISIKFSIFCRSLPDSHWAAAWCNNALHEIWFTIDTPYYGWQTEKLRLCNTYNWL